MIIPIIQYNDGETIGHMEYNQYIAPLCVFTSPHLRKEIAVVLASRKHGVKRGKG